MLGVIPAAVPADGTLGNVRGADTAVVLIDRDGGELVFTGSAVRFGRPAPGRQRPGAWPTPLSRPGVRRVP